MKPTSIFDRRAVTILRAIGEKPGIMAFEIATERKVAFSIAQDYTRLLTDMGLVEIVDPEAICGQQSAITTTGRQALDSIDFVESIVASSSHGVPNEQ